MDNIRVKQESLYDWRSTITEECECDCNDCGQDPCIKCGESHHGIEEAIGNSMNKSYDTSDWRNEFHPTEIESIDIIKNEPLVNEGRTSRYREFDVGGSGHKDSLHRGTNEKIIHGTTGVNYNLVKNKDKKKK